MNNNSVTLYNKVSKCQAFVYHNADIRYNEFMDYDVREAWYEFINDAYVQFRGNTRATITDFAKWIDIPQAQMSQYMTKGGKLPKQQQMVNKFVRRLGVKVYEVLQQPVPDDSLLLLPEPMRTIAREIRETLAAKYIPEDAPEAGEVVDDILKKHGYNLISTRDEPSE